MARKNNTHGGARAGAGRIQEFSDDVKFVMRMPKKLHAKAKKDALKNNMSMNRFLLKAIDERYMFAADLETKVDKILENSEKTLETVESWTE